MNTETQFNEEPKHGKVYCVSGFCGSFKEYNSAAKKPKQKTAMKALVELLKVNDTYKECMPYIIEIIDEVYLPMEKEQIINAHDSSGGCAKEYYNETFK